MKKVSLFVSAILLSATALAIGPMEIKPDGKGAAGKEVQEVTNYRAKLASANLGDVKTDGLNSLMISHPEITPLVRNVVNKLGEGPSQEALKADPRFYSALIEKVDINASQANEIRSNEIKLGTYGTQLVEAKEALVGVFGEIVQSGAKANKPKAAKVADLLSQTSVNSLKDEVASQTKVLEIEKELGVKLEDFIKRCLEMLKK